MRTLYLLRGLPGAGKSTFAKRLDGQHYESDMYFYDTDGNYNFDASKLYNAHKWCENNVNHIMSFGKKDMIVSNTFTTEKELKPYLEMAKEHNYRVVSLVIENRHGNNSIHNVPDETMDKMQRRFTFKLR